MTLILTIENQESVPVGVPVSVRLGTSGCLDIGRNANLDWTLPDPSRFISGKHCEVRHRDDGYWLYDLSTNGTFLNHDVRRLPGPHRLRDGDRLGIGSYIIAVTIDPDEETAPWPGVAAKVLDGMPALGPAEPVPERSRVAATGAGTGPLLEGGLGTLAGELGCAAALTVSAEPVVHEAAAQSWQPVDASSEPADGVAGASAPEAERSAAPIEAHVREARAWREPERAPRAVSSPPVEEPEAVPRDVRPSAQDAQITDEHLRRFAAAAGIPEHIFAGQDGLKVAADLGALTRMAVESLVQLLGARFQAERLARVSRQTMIQALDNNPLKFAPTPDDALKIMFGPRTSGYLDARRAFEGAFTDLKTHQINTFAAMQQAVRMLVEDLDPKSIDESVGPDRGLDAFFGSRKAKLWDAYHARWQAKAHRHEDGLVGAFMNYFGECYDEAKETKAAHPK